MSSVGLTAKGPVPSTSPHTYRAADLYLRAVGGEELVEYVRPWKLLVARALSANPFYEPWMLLPAVEHLGAERCKFLLVFGPAERRSERELLGFFPLEVNRTCLHLPIRTLSFWQHRYCFLTVPLIDRDQAWPVLEAFWRWWESSPFGCHVLDTNLLLAEGRFHEIWSDFAIGRTSLLLNEYARAAFYPAGNFESYIATAIKRKHMQEFDRQERKLRQLYTCEYREVTSESEVDSWMDAFLAVESLGWKGAPGGGAFASHSNDEQFFRAITRSGFAQNRVMLLRLDCSGKPVALKFNLISGGSGFAFKIAFDEAFSKYSPGVLLELENMRRIFREGRLEWMDSCAAARHPMADRLWSERRMIRRTFYADGSQFGNLIVAGFPLLRWLRDRIRRQSVPENLRVSTHTK